MLPIILIYPNLSPNIVDFGSLKITWYGLSYVIGIIFAVLNIKFLDRTEKKITTKILDDLIMYSVFGIILGGRLFYVLFYNLQKYLSDPIAIFKTWEGGMSFHGGLVGVAVACYLVTRKHNLKFFFLADKISVVAPIGIFFGRVANFINGELVGAPTGSKDYGMIFMHIDNLPRHPSQLYEAFLEGIVLYILMNLFYRIPNIRQKLGMASGLFLLFYALFRSLVELFREPDVQVGLLLGGFSMGQLLSFVMFFAGVIIIFTARIRQS